MENSKLFDLLLSQRYFHLVALKVNSDYSIDSYWKDSGVGRKRRNIKKYDFSDFRVEQGRIQSDVVYYGGDVDYSVNGDGMPPFHYDLFVIEIKKLNLYILGFPFRQLARSIVSNLLANKSLKTTASFLRADITKLVKINHNIDFVDDTFVSYFSTVDLRLTGDSKITSVNLDGDRPLQSDLYQDVFKNLLEQNLCNLNKCSMKFEVNSSETLPKTKSNIHIDRFGNYKLYIHGTGNNILTVPLLFNLLKKHKCFDFTLLDPTMKIYE